MAATESEEVLPKIQLEPEAETEDAKPEEKLPEIAEPDSDEDNIGERKPITHLPRSRKLSLLICSGIRNGAADLSGNGRIH